MAVLPQQAEFWLEQSADAETAFLSAVADLIFVERHRYPAHVLRAALDVEVRDYHRVGSTVASDDEEEEDDDRDETSQVSDEDEPGESVHPHPGGEPDPSLNKPKPAPLHRGLREDQGAIQAFGAKASAGRR